KSLLEHNQNLKTDYDKLLQNVSNLNESSGDDMRLISNKRAFDKIIESLQHKNEEIQHMLDRTNQHSRASQQTYERNQRKLETEIEILQKKELSTKMEILHKENGYLIKSKRSLEEKLAVTLKDLECLRREFEQFEVSQQGYLTLQEAFRRQTDHVKELNERLEEHQVILSRHHQSDPITHSSNLMHELNSANNKDTYSKLYNFASLTEKHLALFYNAPADYAFDTILSTVGIGDRAALQEAEKLLCDDDPELFGPSNESIYAELDLYPSQPIVSQEPENPKGLVHRILIHIRYLFRSVFRWCRFALILVTAVLINLWKGPDLILDK
ncbi:hypothetical protein CU098_007358, partial [Rhizopus stolonifer]